MRRIVLSVMMALVLSATFIHPVSEGNAAFSIFSSHKKIKDTDGKIQIPITDVSDGKAHYYQYKNSGSTVKFFVVKSSDGTIRAAFDACDVCFPAKKGYSQDGDFMICNNCGKRFHSSRINVVKGGCNPAPLNRQVVGKNLVINVDDIIPGSRFF
jgi:uncharacterized membrane protein